MSTGPAEISGPLYGGACIAHFEGDQSVFSVPFTLPGERIRARRLPLGSRREPPRGELVDILSASPERVEPRCRHFGVCGGCQYQHASQSGQLAMKRQVLLDALGKAGVPATPLEVHAAEPWHYRNRVRFRVEGTEFGYSRRESNAFLPISECPITSGLLWRTVEAGRQLRRSGSAAWPEPLAEVELFTDADETAVQISMRFGVTMSGLERDTPALFRALCERWRGEIPEIVGAGLSILADPLSGDSKRVAESRRIEVARWGDAGLHYRVGDSHYDVTRNAFFQVNRFLTARMVELVCGERSGGRVYDLFAGAGLFSLPLARRFHQVVAVEIGQPAADDLARALKALGADHRAEQRTVLDFLKAQTPVSPPDLIVMDPPRAGLGEPVVRELNRIRAPDMVYVSCDPITFARDTKALLKSGYTLQHLHLFDLFPQTFHLETIAVFHR